ERMPKLEMPEAGEEHIFTGEISPVVPGSKWVFQSEHLKIGYDRALLEITMRIRKGQKIGLLGPNGVGKTTFLKTVAGLCQPIDGEYSLGNHITIGYFDQHSAEIESEKSVVEHFHDLFPAMTEKDVRSVLGAYLFGGRDAAKKVSSLSGGEKARLVLAELLQSRPNFLILDEPTNHMDVQAKETLESAFQAYTGTILFVSHDRYFIKQVADAVMIFENQAVMYYPFGYEHYLERLEKQDKHESIAAQISAEEQALIAGIRAVPKVERHRLREIPTEEAYADWRTRLAAEAMDRERENVEGVWRQLEILKGQKQQWQESEEFWMNEQWPVCLWSEEKRLAELTQEYEILVQKWHEKCLEWAEIAIYMEE
ncbi:MAG: ABC-F family ATP-binding cassette domain-containing protein, partial [Clostridium sp.]|nr:ABC-F family ATP-binding cassette domain-containing protein [Clostridium sp.]